jgi:hypothetical protein
MPERLVGTFMRRSDGLICDICHKIYPNRNALRQVDPSALRNPEKAMGKKVT